jgi:hypothetical protein
VLLKELHGLLALQGSEVPGKVQGVKDEDDGVPACRSEVSEIGLKPLAGVY